jgi:hypothetical protein
MKLHDPTREQVKQEVTTCVRDPAYFIENYVEIRHPVRGLIPFKLFPYQKRLVRDYVKNRFNAILKARQLGISELTAAFIVWLMNFNRNRAIMVVATKAETAKNMIKKIRTAFRVIQRKHPWILTGDLEDDNKLSISLTNGSWVKCSTTSEDVGRSEALSLLVIDEAAHIRNLDDIWTGLARTTQAGGSMVVISTPKGVGNKFHQICRDAETGDNDFHLTTLMWWEHPEYATDLADDPEQIGGKTSTWFRNEVQAHNMGPREIAQELCCDFLASGDTVIAPDVLQRIQEREVQDVPKELWRPDRSIWIFEPPVAGRQYMIVGDVATGHGKDGSGCHVFDIDSMDQVAEYYGKVTPDEYARVMTDMGSAYNDALLIVENNSVGLACLEHVKLLGYPNVYYSRRGDDKPGRPVNTRFGTYDPDLIPGFTTSPRVRPLMVSKLEEYTRIGKCRIRSSRLLAEFRTFIWNNGRAEAMRGYNDDLTMAAAIAFWLRDTFVGPSVMTADAQRKILMGITSTRTTNATIPGASKDPRIVPHRSMGVFVQGDPTQFFGMDLPNGHHVDFAWVLQRVPIIKG